MGVGEGPDMLDDSGPTNGGRGAKSANGGRKSAAKRAAKSPAKGAAKRRPTSAALAALTADPADADVSIAVAHESAGAPRGRNRGGGDDTDNPNQRRGSRERSLHRLLAGLRAVNAGDFSVRLTANGDPLMADIIDVFNSVDAEAGAARRRDRARQHVGRSRRQDARPRRRWPASAASGSTAVDSVN